MIKKARKTVDNGKTEAELKQAVLALQAACNTYNNKYPAQPVIQSLLETLDTNCTPAEKITAFTKKWQESATTTQLTTNEKSEKDDYTKQFRRHIVAILVTVLTAGVAAALIAALGYSKPNAQGTKDLWRFYRKPTKDEATSTFTQDIQRQFPKQK